MIVDILYYSNIELFYTYAYTGLIPLLVKYYIYAIRSLKEEYIEYLDKWYYVDKVQIRAYEGYPTRFYEKVMYIREFVELKSYGYTGADDETLDMTKCECGFQLALFKKYNKQHVTEEEHIIWKKDFYALIPVVVIDITRFLDTHDGTIEIYADRLSGYRGKRLYIIWVSIAVYSGYMAYWVYIYTLYKFTHLLSVEF